jgi:erythromycin esterase-like protein
MNVRQNAQVIVTAERYYRAMITAGPTSWNIRDRHMVHTLENLMEFHGADAKGIIWEHNTHIGDARATDMCDDGTVNVGQIINEEHKPEEVFSGFGSYKGTVIAEWGCYAGCS